MSKDNEFSLDDDFTLPEQEEPLLPDVDDLDISGDEYSYVDTDYNDNNYDSDNNYDNVSNDNNSEFSLNVSLDDYTSQAREQEEKERGDSLNDILSSLDDDDHLDSEYEDASSRNRGASLAVGQNSSVSMYNDDGDNYYDNDDNDDEYPFDSPDVEDDFDFSTSFRADNRGGIDIDQILIKAIELNASDVHMNPDGYVSFTILGDIVHMKDFGIMPANVVQRSYHSVVSHASNALLSENWELDTSYVIKKGEHKGRRFRLSVGRSMGNIFMVFRVVSNIIPTPDDLGVPDSLRKWTQLPNGLVLICGPTGTGKSTTFASLINQINQGQPKKIITVERPIEYVYPNDGVGLITQREVGMDSHSFSNALTSAMRQAPDVIMIGEVRDKEEVDSLLRASESGHLAFSTMHTSSPPGTINRIKSLYQGDEQLRVLSSLKDNVRGIANQVLLKTKDGRGRFALQCSLDVTPEISDLIGLGDVGSIQEYMIEHKQTLDHILVKAVVDGRCDVEEARSKSVFPEIFDDVLSTELKNKKGRR